jgi:hypothetical protein
MQELLRVKKSTLATRCEICHQPDLFDPIKNLCLRCSETFSETKTEKKINNVLATEKCKIFHPTEIHLEINICSHCSNLSLEAKKQDISEIRPGDWLTKVNIQQDANLDSYEVFKLFLFTAFCILLIVVWVGLTLYPVAVCFLVIFLIGLKTATTNLFYYIKKNR